MIKSTGKMSTLYLYFTEGITAPQEILLAKIAELNNFVNIIKANDAFFVTLLELVVSIFSLLLLASFFYQAITDPKHVFHMDPNYTKIYPYQPRYF